MAMLWIFVLSLALISPLQITAQQQSRCVQVFDAGFRKCFRDSGGFELDIVFALVTNETSGRLPPNLAPQKKNMIQLLCGNRPTIVNCITPLVTNADPTCQQKDIGMMDGTVNSMVSGLGNLCGAPTQGSTCMKNFDAGFRQCLTSLQINADNFFLMLADQALPPNVNKDQLKQMACSDATKSKLMKCATDILATIQKDCKPQETIMVGTTLQNMMGAFEGVCTGKPVNPDQCMTAFEDGMNTCAQKTLNMDMKMILMVLNGQSLPPGQDSATMKKQICSKWSNLENCGKDMVIRNAAQCSGRPQTLMVEASFANMMITTATYCGDTCKCKVKRSLLCATMVTVASKWKPLEMCGKDVVLSAGCDRSQLLGVEATFANMVISIATSCGDKSLPGACLLTLQKQFGECFGKVGLSPEVYLSNQTDHKGALIGANTAEAQVYCGKKHDLFTCMNEVIHECPGAEQTLSLTGFDLHGMERAVGILCHNIPDYLKGLECFEQPTQKARECMEEMTMAITDLSTKQITQKLNMDSFFADFCTARVSHVACDSVAWPSCETSAVSLKNEFECQLIPSRCYNSHKDNIDTICPNTDVYIPGEESGPHVHEQPMCVQEIHQSMNSCFQKFNMKPDMFLVNVTHDRSNFMGDVNMARSLCQSKESVFGCMRSVLNQCPAAEDVLSYWGHQQTSLIDAVNVICQNLPLYNKGVQCFSKGNSQVSQCISNTESKMMNLADKQVTKNLSPDSYFRDFCSIRMEHLKCDLTGWRQSCAADIVGLKTEFECALIQEHCKNLQVSTFQNLCNPTTYAANLRSGSSGGTGTQTGSGDNGAMTSSAGVFVLFTSVVSALVMLL